MSILFIISIVALLALLWASISIAGYIRKARIRQRRASRAARQPTHVAADAPSEAAQTATPLGVSAPAEESEP